jgi:hypothetical protein
MGYKEPVLLFLTLDGRKSKTARGAPYFPMSYRDHICEQWLPACLEHRAWPRACLQRRLPVSVEGGLIQYRDTVRRIANTKSFLEDDPIVDFIVDKLALAYSVSEAIENAKSLLQARFWKALQGRLARDPAAEGLTVALTDNWNSAPNANYVGVFVSLPDLGTLGLSILQQSDMIFFQVEWGAGSSVWNDYEYLMQRDDVKALDADLQREYGVSWERGKKRQMGWIWREINLRKQDTAERLSKSADNVVAEVAIDFSQFCKLCLRNLRQMRLKPGASEQLS